MIKVLPQLILSFFNPASNNLRSTLLSITKTNSRDNFNEDCNNIIIAFDSDYTNYSSTSHKHSVRQIGYQIPSQTPFLDKLSRLLINLKQLKHFFSSIKTTKQIFVLIATRRKITSLHVIVNMTLNRQLLL